MAAADVLPGVRPNVVTASVFVRSYCLGFILEDLSIESLQSKAQSDIGALTKVSSC
jgi:hypothetical protein